MPNNRSSDADPSPHDSGLAMKFSKKFGPLQTILFVVLLGSVGMFASLWMLEGLDTPRQSITFALGIVSLVGAFSSALGATLSSVQTWTRTGRQKKQVANQTKGLSCIAVLTLALSVFLFYFAGPGLQ